MFKRLLIILITICVVLNPIYSNELFKEPQIELAEITNYSSPSSRFNASTSMSAIEYLLYIFGATTYNKAMFTQMMGYEKPGFFGYHGGCSDYRIFQDIIKIALEEYLGIPIRQDFQFLRVPGLSSFQYDSADAFVAAHPTYNDNFPEIKKHIFSLNMALFKSWDADGDFTPRYFLQNKPWSEVQFENELSPFFKKFGLENHHITTVFKLARKHVPQNKGMILQLFDSSHNKNDPPYAFLNQQAYVGTASSKIQNTLPSDYYIDSLHNNFPQLRLVMNNYYTLNPHSPLIIIRYHTMTPAKEDAYEAALRSLMRSLPIDKNKAETFRKELLSCWYYDVF